jgi:hypothetical protein
MIAHRLSLDDFVRIIVLERKRIFGLRAFECDAADVGQKIEEDIGVGSSSRLSRGKLPLSVKALKKSRRGILPLPREVEEASCLFFAHHGGSSLNRSVAARTNR